MKIKKILLWSIAISLVVFVLMFIYVIKTKSADISRYTPFSEWIGKTVILPVETVLFEDRDPFNKKYPAILYDSLHPDWQQVEQRKQSATDAHHTIRIFPAGSRLTIEKAMIYTNGVSGFSTAMLFGTISDSSKNYPVSYKWGTYSAGRAFDQLKECWSFHQAPWQLQRDTSYYYLPEGNW
ncbi:hypothetical protein [Gynurincola endophyticus]|uniref:hypothetical protein n=1 Tax=Gynurincola endophyticus TaxID=2479004 RepID=UPI000F8F6A6E|nr:hypothetical protein [Gynurincola endophyticus]